MSVPDHELEVPCGKIRVEYIAPPIPSTHFDYQATLEGYEPGDAIGFGPTAEAAIDDLLAQVDD